MSTEIAKNKKALRDYHISEKLEAGLVLVGTEVKSIRAGRVNLSDAYARIENREALLYGCDIQPYAQASHGRQHEAKRPRKLLLSRKEIIKLTALTAEKGFTLVALRLYWKNHLVKVEIGVGKGKEQRDKREDLKKKAADREAQRAMAQFQKGR